MLPAAPSRARVRAWFAALAVGLLALLALVVPAGAAHAADDDGLVLVGVGGLHWSDIDRTTTPQLWGMVSEGSVGSISVHALAKVTCPLDAWLTISAASRVSAPADEAAGTTTCDDLPDVRTTTEPRARVRGWADLVDPSAQPGVAGTPGTVGRRVDDSERCANAIGPGAAVALARPDGRVTRYFDALDVDGSVLRSCAVTVLDVGELPTDRAARLAALAALDDQLRTITAQVPIGTDVVVAGVSDSPTGEAGLQAVVDWRRGGGPVAWLTSQSTRLPGVVTLTDLSATIVQRVGGETSDLDGSPLETGSERRMSTQRTLDNRRYLTEMTTVTPYLLPVVLAVAGVGVAAVVGAVAVSRRRRPRGPGRALGRLAIAAVLVGASMPAGAQLAVLSRWWVRPAPLVAATVWFTVGTIVVALVSWLLSRLLPRGPWRVAVVAAGVSWLLTTVDGVTGTVLQQGSVFGITPTSGARYFGFGNTTFGAYAAAALVLAGALAVGGRAVGRRRAGLVAAVVVAVLSVLVDGWPTFGADFGGALTLVLAFAVLLLPLTSVGLTPRRVVVALGAAVAVVAVVAVVDWARPGRSTHLGLFVQRIIDGDALDVVGRKAAGAWATVDQPAGAAAAVVCLVVCAVLVGPDRWRPAVLHRLYDEWDGLRATLRAVVVAAVAGSLVNDSGVVVAVVLLAVAGALLGASAMADAWGERRAPADERAGEPVLRAMPAVVVATGGVLGVLLLLTTSAFPLAAQAGGATRADGPALLTGGGAPVVVVGTGGVSWDDVTRERTPTLWGLLRDGAPAAGVMAAGVEKCPAQGWLSISSGATTVADEKAGDTYVCRSWAVVPDGDGASVQGWGDLLDAQPAAAHLGVLGDGLTACSTAVGPGAALGLAHADGSVARYRTLDAALADPSDALACPVTMVDAGTAANDASSVDETLRSLLAVIPTTTTVLVVDTARAEPGTEALGVGVVRIGRPAAATYLTSPSTRSTGVVRLTDTTATLLADLGADVPTSVLGAPVVIGDERPSQVDVTVDQLASVNVRTHLLHDATVPLAVGAGVLALLLGWAHVAARRRPRVRSAVDVALVVLACLPAGAVVAASTGWWRGEHATAGLWLSSALCTAAVAGGAGLVGRRVRWAPAATVAVFTWVLLVLDVPLGGRLTRGGLLGAPTATGRPSVAIVVVLGLSGIATAWVARELLRRAGRPRLGLVAAAVVLAATVALLLVGA